MGRTPGRLLAFLASGSRCPSSQGRQGQRRGDQGPQAQATEPWASPRPLPPMRDWASPVPWAEGGDSSPRGLRAPWARGWWAVGPRVTWPPDRNPEPTCPQP